MATTPKMYKSGGSGSFGALNAKYLFLQTELANLIGGGGVPTSSDLADVLLNGDSAGASDIDMNNNDILNCNNLQAVTINGNPIGGAQNINQVLGVGNTSLDKSQIFTATASTISTNIDNAEVNIINSSGGINTLLEYDKLTIDDNAGSVNILDSGGELITSSNATFSYSTTVISAGISSSQTNTTTAAIEVGSIDFTDGVAYTNNNFSVSGNDTKLSMKANPADGVIRCFNGGLPSALAPLNFQASALTLNGNPIIATTPTITQVLTAGNNALDVSQTFSATGSPTTTNIDDAEVEIIDGVSGINTKLEYDRLTLTGNYAPYNTNNIVSNTGMAVSATDNFNNIQYNTSSTYTDLNIQKQPQTTFVTETTGTNFIDGVFYQTNNTFSFPTEHTKLSMKASAIDGTITCYNLATSTSAPLDFQASALTLNGAPFPTPTTPDLNQVLTAGNNAGGLSITGLNNVDLSTINSTSYPPATPSWNDTLTVSATAIQDINMNSYNINGVNNINLNTINGLSPTTIGLNWADFTGTNAYSNLPSQAYQVYSFPYQTSQYYNRFEVFDNNTPSYTTFDTTGMTLTDITSGTATSYGSNNIQSTNGTAFTITAGSGASQILNLNCSQLVINGNAYPPAIPTIRPLFYSNNASSFILSSGSWTNQGTVYTFNLQPNTGYIMSVNFTLYTDQYEASGAMYLETYNSLGVFPPSTYTSTRPVARIGNANTFGAGGSGTSQFVFQDIINFTTDSNGQLIMDLYLGHNGGTWTATYNWSMFANILSP